ncbi:MAG: DUF2793 domain-containing protein [Pseudomonadota bacterium]
MTVDIKNPLTRLGELKHALWTITRKRALSITTTATPASPTEGDVYIVPGVGVTGDWVGNENAIAVYSASAWIYITPVDGDEVTVADIDQRYRFEDSAWALAASGGGASYPPFPTNAGNFLRVNATETDVEWAGISLDVSGEPELVYSSNQVTNPDFETGDLTGWTVQSGDWSATVSASAATSAGDNVLLPRPGGGTYFGFNRAGEGVLYQDISVLPGSAFVSYSGYLGKDLAGDVATLVLRQFDAGMNEVSLNQRELSDDATNTWAFREGTVAIAPTATTVRLELFADNTAGSDAPHGFDDVSVQFISSVARYVDVTPDPGVFVTGWSYTGVLTASATIDASHSWTNTFTDGKVVIGPVGNGSGEATATIDLTSRATEVDAGNLSVIIDWYMAVTADTGNDRVRVRPYFKDMLSAEITQTAYRSENATDYSSNEVAGSREEWLIPPGTRSLEVEFDLFLQTGSFCNSFLIDPKIVLFNRGV